MPRSAKATLAALSLCALAFVVLSWTFESRPIAPGLAEAQPRSVKVFRVGVLSYESPPAGQASPGSALVEGLKDLGYVEGQLFALQRARIAALAAQSGLPTAYGLLEYVEMGGLIGYGPNRRELFRQVAGYVDRILKGARPRDLPVQQPSKLDLVVNLRTAKALGLTIRPSVLQRATAVIQ